MNNDVIMNYLPDKKYIELFLNNIKTQEQKEKILGRIESLISKSINKF